MLDIIRKISSISFLLLFLISCKADTRDTEESSQIIDKILIETNSGHQFSFKKINFFKTKSGAVYLEILDNNDDLLKNHLKKASITLNGNVYEVKIVKQFFDKTIIGDSFFLTVDNKTGNLIVDVVDGKSLFLIGFEKNVIKTLKKEAVIVNDI